MYLFIFKQVKNIWKYKHKNSKYLFKLNDFKKKHIFKSLLF